MSVGRLPALLVPSSRYVLDPDDDRLLVVSLGAES